MTQTYPIAYSLNTSTYPTVCVRSDVTILHSFVVLEMLAFCQPYSSMQPS